MPTYTQHFRLIKPLKTELYDIDDVTNRNADFLDNELYNKIDKIKNAENNIPVIDSEGNIKDSGKNLVSIANAFMVSELPEPSEDYNNICYMYIGDSNGELETNNFYKCILDKTTNKYIWQKTVLSGITHTVIENMPDIPNLLNLSDES